MSVEPEWQAATVPMPKGEIGLQKALVRCNACLTSLYIPGNQDVPVRYWYPCIVCELGRLHFQGWLNDGRIKKPVDHLYCDPTCNTARGLDCECKCGGLYHGYGHVLVWTESRDIGKAPVLKGIDVEQAKQIARQYLDARQALKDSVKELSEKKRNGVWMPRPEFDKWLEVERKLTKASKLLTHSGRMKVLTA